MKRPPHKTGAIWISGINQVLETLRTDGGKIHELIVTRTDRRVEEITERAGHRGIPILHKTRDELSAILGYSHHQGVALRVDEYPYTPLETVLDRPMAEREPLLAMDSIQDPQNFGAILRSGCFLGAKGVIVPKDRSVRVTSTVIKVAAGAAAHVSVIEVTNLARSLEQLKSSGLWIAGLDVQGEVSLYEADLSVPLVLVVGSEQKGLRPLVRKQCDLLLKIPAYGPLQSLNAATACAIALAEVQRRRGMGSGLHI